MYIYYRMSDDRCPVAPPSHACVPIAQPKVASSEYQVRPSRGQLLCAKMMRLSMALLAALLVVSISPRHTCEGFMLSPRMASFAGDGVGGVLPRFKARASNGLQGRGMGGSIPFDSSVLRVMMSVSETTAEDLPDKKYVSVDFSRGGRGAGGIYFSRPG